MCNVDGMMANLDGMFNVTATYEDDADLSLPYGYYYKREKPLANFLPQNTNRYSSLCRVACDSLYFAHFLF